MKASQGHCPAVTAQAQMLASSHSTQCFNPHKGASSWVQDRPDRRSTTVLLSDCHHDSRVTRKPARLALGSACSQASWACRTWAQTIMAQAHMCLSIQRTCGCAKEHLSPLGITGRHCKVHKGQQAGARQQPSTAGQHSKSGQTDSKQSRVAAYASWRHRCAEAQTAPLGHCCCSAQGRWPHTHGCCTAHWGAVTPCPAHTQAPAPAASSAAHSPVLAGRIQPLHHEQAG